MIGVASKIINKHFSHCLAACLAACDMHPRDMYMRVSSIARTFYFFFELESEIDVEYINVDDHIGERHWNLIKPCSVLYVVFLLLEIREDLD